MLTSAIRHVSAARSAPRVVAAFSERTVQVWDLQTRERLSQFETVLSFGGCRLAFSPDGTRCVAASWAKGKRGGVACYDVTAGRLVWHRTDIRHTQGIRYSGRGDSIWCCLHDGPLQRLDADTGETQDTMRGIADVRDCDDPSQLLLASRNHGFLLLGDRTRFQIPALSFALLDAAFSPQVICLSEAAGPVRCFARDTGAELWRTHWEDRPATGLWYEPEGNLFYAVTDRLLRCSPRIGKWEEICELTCWREDFSPELRLLITSDGDMIEIENGAVTHRLDFPQREVSKEPQADGPGEEADHC